MLAKIFVSCRIRLRPPRAMQRLNGFQKIQAHSRKGSFFLWTNPRSHVIAPPFIHPSSFSPHPSFFTGEGVSGGQDGSHRLVETWANGACPTSGRKPVMVAQLETDVQQMWANFHGERSREHRNRLVERYMPLVK